jgi:hypothetical protein
MIWNSYRDTYERLKADVAVCSAGHRTDLHERAVAALDSFVATVTCDPRKLRAIAALSPGAAAEIRSRAATLDLPRTVLDPVHDLSFAKLWLATLGEDQMRMLSRAVSEELTRRRRDATPAMLAGE